MAWIRKTDRGRWIARYRAPDGRTRSKTYDRKSDAEKWLRVELVRRDRGEWVDPQLGRITFAEWAEKTLAARLDIAASTRARERSVADSLVLPTFGSVQLKAIRTADIEEWVAGLDVAGYAASTVRKAYQLLAAVIASAVRSDLIARSPAVGIRLPRVERKEMRIITPEELANLLEALDGRWRQLVRTAAYTGLRFGELAGLQRLDIDPLRRRVTVRRSLSEVRGKLSVKEPKTKASRRMVAVPRWLAEELGAYLADHETEWLFTAPQGGPLYGSNFRRYVWLPAVRAAHLDGLRFHDLRHTHAAWLIEAGEHPKLIQTRLGHASIRTTLDVYGHLMDGLDEAAAERLVAPPTAVRPNVQELRP